jgi:hypothetical protein
MNATTVHVSLATAPSRNEAEHLPGTQGVDGIIEGSKRA